MSTYLGDYASAPTVDLVFTTVDTTGTPTTLTGTPVVSIYRGNTTAETTVGVTLTTDYDARTCLHHVRVVATDAFYSVGNNFFAVITAGSAASISVVGYEVASFSIENRSPLRPTVAGRTLDVNAAGEAGVDWANVGTQGATVNLTATSISVVTTATNVTSVNSGAVTNTSFAAAAIDAAAIAANAIGASEIADGAIDAATFTTGAITATAIAASAISAVKFDAGAIDAAALAAGAAQEIADEVLNRDLVGGASGNTRNVRNALRMLRNRRTIATTTLSVYQEDDTTVAWSADVTTAAGNPISSIDPA